MKPFTVVIPTRDRADTLIQTLETCLSQKDENFRIIVSDNFSKDSTRAVVENCQKRDGRIEYINPGRSISMSAHWEFALAHVREGMVMVLGDDDGLMPNAISRARSALESRPEALAINSKLAYYKWPKIHDPNAGHLQLPLAPGYEVRDSQFWFNKVAQSEAWYALIPYVYYGFVDVSILDRIRHQSSRLIHSSIPDVFLAVAVSAFIDDFLHLHEPLSIVGCSRHSSGHSHTAPGGNAEIARKFLQDCDIPFHPTLPWIPSIHVITGECILQAQDAGLISRDVEINWEGIIIRTFNEIVSQPFSDEEKRERLVPLSRLSQQVSCSIAQKRIDELLTQRSQMSMFPIPIDLPWHGGQVDIDFDLNDYGTTGIADACKFASVATRAAEHVRNKLLPQLKIENDIAAELHQKLENSSPEITHLTGKLDKLRVKAEAAETKKKHFKEKVESLRAEQKRTTASSGRRRLHTWWRRIRGRT